MKKLLALVLALVMVMSLCVTSNAAFDGEEYDYDEAVEVMAAVGVFQGDGNGKFNGKDELTREQAAKLVAYLDLGEKVAEALPAVKVFNDVEATRWSAKYVAYCADAGYIAGVGDGNFDPNGKLTGYAFGKMLLCALGYDAQIEGFTGASWQIKVAQLMESNDIAKGVDGSASAVLTREQAAQYCFNTLKADCVKYDDNQTITIGNVEIKQSSAAKTYTAANSTVYDDNQLQLLEKLYKEDLEYTASETDKFGRPGHAWTYDGKDVGTYTDAPVAVFTADTKAADVATALKGYKFVDSSDADTFYKVENTTEYSPSVTAKLNYYWIDQLLDGSEHYSTYSIFGGNTTAGQIASETNNGLLFEVYANSDKVITDIICVEYTVDEVTKVTEKKDYTAYTLDYIGSALNVYTDEDKDDEIVFVDGAAAKGDIVMWVEGLDGVVYVYKTTSVKGAQTAFNVDKGTIVVGGETYTVGTGVYSTGGYVAVSDFGNSEKTDNTYYFDQFGYAVKTTAAAASTDYAFVVAAYGKSTTNVDGTTYSVQVKAVLADGTVGTYDVALNKSSGNYNIKNVDSTVLTTGNVNTRAQALVNNLYGYTLSDKTITFETVNATFADDTTVQFRNNWQYTANYQVKKNSTSVIVGGSTPTTVILPKTTTIVVYDTDAETAKVYEGTASLGTTILNETNDGSTINFRGVAKADSSTTGTASLIFALVDGGIVKAADNYAFVDSTKYTQKLADGKTTYVYEATLADASTLKLHSSDALSGSGLYKYDEDGLTKDAYLLKGDSAGISDLYGYGQVTVSGDMLSIGGGYYDMSEADVVYVDDDLDEVNGNYCFFVLVEDSSDVEAIFVVG